MNEQRYNLAELTRRMNNIVRAGTITELGALPGRARVQLAPELTTAFLPWLTSRAGTDVTWWAPEIGEQVIVLSPSGDLAAGYILPSLYSDALPAWSDNPDISGTHWADGATDEYDRDIHKRTITLPDDGEITITVGQTSVKANADTAIITVGDTLITATADDITLDAPTIKLGTGTLKDVARKGDAVDPNTHKIIEGSAIVSAA